MYRKVTIPHHPDNLRTLRHFLQFVKCLTMGNILQEVLHARIREFTSIITAVVLITVITQPLESGSEYSLEGVRQVQIGMWLQLIVVPPRLYSNDCPSISEGKVRGSVVWKRVQRSQRCVR